MFRTFSRLTGVLCLLAGCGTQHIVLEQGTGDVDDEMKASISELRVKLVKGYVDSWVRRNGRIPTTDEFAVIALGPESRGDARTSDDYWGTPIRFDVPSKLTWIVRSAGVDRKFDTEDDIKQFGTLGPSP